MNPLNTLSRSKLNLISAIAEQLIGAASIFLIYKIILKNLGLDLLGIWSLIISITSIAAIGVSGFSGSAIKFVAKYQALEKKEKIKSILNTVLITVFCISFFMLLIIGFFIYVFRSELFDDIEFSEVSKIYPYLILSFSCSYLSGVISASLDGLNLIYLRSIVGILSNLIYLLATIISIRFLGLEGIAISLLLKNLISLLIGILFLKRYSNIKNIFNLRFEKEVFREIFNYGYQLQFISIFQMLIDPMTKIMLKNFGGLALIGYHEIIYKFMFYARQLIVSGVNTLIPSIASASEINKSLIVEKIQKSYSITIVLSTILFSIIFISTPVILRFLNVSINLELSLYSILIFIGLYGNLLGLIPFTFNIGLGSLKYNLISMAVMAVCNVFFGYCFGKIFGGTGVIAGWSIAQILSTTILIFLFKKEIVRSWSSRFQMLLIQDYSMFFGIFLIICSFSYINNYLELNLWLGYFLNLLLAFVVLYLLFKDNPRKKTFLQELRTIKR